MRFSAPSRLKILRVCFVGHVWWIHFMLRHGRYFSSSYSPLSPYRFRSPHTYSGALVGVTAAGQAIEREKKIFVPRTHKQNHWISHIHVDTQALENEGLYKQMVTEILYGCCWCCGSGKTGRRERETVKSDANCMQVIHAVEFTFNKENDTRTEREWLGGGQTEWDRDEVKNEIDQDERRVNATKSKQAKKKKPNNNWIDRMLFCVFYLPEPFVLFC